MSREGLVILVVFVSKMISQEIWPTFLLALSLVLFPRDKRGHAVSSAYAYDCMGWGHRRGSWHVCFMRIPFVFANM